MKAFRGASLRQVQMHLHQQLHFILQGRPRDVSMGYSEDVGGARRCWGWGQAAELPFWPTSPVEG